MARPKSEEKYNAIMQATLQVVTAEGFHGLSMSKIAKTAEVATATIYIYFENTEAIINQLYQNLKEFLAKDVMKDYQVHMEVREAFGLIWKNFYNSILQHPEAFNYLEQFANSPYITQISREEGQRQFKPMMDFFDVAAEKGEIQQMPKEVLMALFMSPLVTLAKKVIANHIKMTDEILEMAVENTWKAIKN